MTDPLGAGAISTFDHPSWRLEASADPASALYCLNPVPPKRLVVEVWDVDGGIISWNEAGLPLEN